MPNIDLSTLSVLVVDDESFMRRLLVRALGEISIKNVFDAADGAQALKMIKTMGSEIDIVLCDLNMPKMDGFEFVQELRKISDPVQAGIPVLIVSGNSDEQSVRNALGLGINGFLVKPVNASTLEQKINKALLSPMLDLDQAKE